MKRFRFWLISSCLLLAAVLWLRQAQRGTPAVPSVAGETGGREPAEQNEETLERTTANLMPATAAFRTWAQRYFAETTERRLSLLTEGTQLANEHRLAMLPLIQENPQAALAQAIPMVVRQDLPEEITRLLEERINAEGFFGVLGLVQEGNGTGTGIRRIAEIAGRTFETFVYGRRAAQRTTERLNFVGVAIDGKLALDESPLREMEPGERPNTTKEIVQTCPISGKSTVVERNAAGDLPAISPDTPAAEVGPQIIYLCHGGHFLAMKDGLVAKEGSSGGAAKPTGAIPSSWTTGPRKVLYIRAIFPDNPTEPQSEVDAYVMMRSVSEFMAEVSYGKCYFLNTVTPLIMLPHTLDWYNYNNTDGSAYAVLSDARSAAKEAGFDSGAYDLYAVRYNGPGSFSGQGYVGGSGTWLKNSSVGVAVHEFGHNLGLWHANYWSTSPASTIGSGQNSEYGHSFDTMGSASAGAYHFNAQHRTSLNWLPNSNYTNLTTSGLYRIHQIDQPVLNPSLRYALNFRKDAQRTYWAEFRQKFTSNPWLMNGLQLCWGPWGDTATDNTASGSNGGAQLLDTTPSSPDGKDDAGIVIGKTFSDREAGIHCTVVGKGGTTPESLDVQVNLGLFLTNQAPVISSLGATNLTPGTGVAITLTTTASDPDSDALAYAWDFGDRTLGANSASVTKSWPTAGNYWVRCEVSDMKGQVAASAILITVGSPTTLLASGHVYDDLGAPMVGVRVGNGSTGTSYRGSLTDSMGAFTVTNLTAGYTLAANLPNWTFAAAGADFNGTPSTNVTVTAVDATAVEGSVATTETGTFRFTRTGSTSSALVLRAQLSGGAVYITDYTLSPAPTANLGQYNFTIPAGQSTLDVILTPAGDSAIEGPELAGLTLVPGSGYATQGATKATITIDDLDTTLPVISLVPLDAQASEAGDPAIVILRRTGNPSNALTVTIGLGAGTAASGQDFTALPTTITFPADAAETSLTLTPLTDAAIEGTETVVINLLNGAAYLRDPAALTTTLQILDANIPTIAITATDATAAEAGQDVGMFTVTRTGATTAALQVEYAVSGSALQGVDYASLTGTLSIPAGQASAPIVIYPFDDAIGEASQSVIITLRSEPKYLIGTASATVNIADNDLPMISLVASDGDCAENGGLGTFRINSAGTGSGAVTVNYTVSGTATAGTDYTALTGSVSVTKAGGSATITLTPLQDTDPEDAESVTITLTPDAAYTTTLDRAATILINDDDQPMVSVTYDTATTLSEGSSGGFYLSRSGSTTAALTVNYTLSGLATVGLDYSDPGISVTIPAGAAGILLGITTLADAAVEGTEEITLTMQSSAGTYGSRVPSATLFISDSQNASLTRTLRFSITASTVAETAGTLNLPVALSTSATSPITVEYVISSSTATGGGVDYSFTPGLLTFAAGETAKTIPLTLRDDPFVEPSKNVVLTLRNCLGAARLTSNTYTLTITSDDLSPEPLLNFAQATSAITEGPSAASVITVNLSSAQSYPVTVDYSVTAGTASVGGDYTGGAGTLTIATGQTSAQITVPIVDDGLPESTETLTLTLSNAIGASLSAPFTHVITITDDDQAYVSIAATDAVVGEAGPDPGTLTITRTGNLALALEVALTATGTATSGTDYIALPATVALAAGVASVEVIVTPVDDVISDANETVIVSLGGQGTVGGGSAGSGNYVISPPFSATLTIIDNENAAPTISIVSPIGGLARLPNAQVGLWLQTNVTDDALPANAPLTATWTMLSGPGSVTFDDAAQVSTGAVFSQPGEYVLRLSANDTLLTTVSDIRVSVEPVPWQSADVGDASTRPGSFTQSGGVYSVTGSGGGVTTGTTDGNFFVYRSLPGDGEIIARLTSLTNGGTSTRCGVMMRGSTASNAQHALSSVTSNRSSLVYRTTTGVAGITVNTNITGTSTPRWVRMVRAGNTFKAYVSTDTTPLAWVQQGTTQTITMTNPILMGLSVTNASTAASVTAGFDNVQVITPNMAPNVSAGGDSLLFAPQSLTLAGSTSDDAKPTTPGQVTLAWGKRSGPGTVTFSDAAQPAPTAAFSAVGTYMLRLRASDGQATTFDDVTVTVTEPVVVGVTANPLHAAERNLVPSNFTLSRATATSDSITVNFTLTGSAANGVDYTSVAGTASIPALATTAIVTISPLADALSEGAETITLTISRNAAYQVDPSGPATLTLDDQPLDSWKRSSFGLDANSPSISGPAEDPDRDGLQNLLEYAFNANPSAAGSLSLYETEISPTTMSLTYAINPLASDVTVQPLWTDDLSTWFATEFTLQTLSETSTTKVLKATLPVDATHPRRLMKTQVEMLAP